MLNDIHDRLTPARLTQILREHGHLAQGEVVALRVTDRFDTPPSNIAKITVDYSPSAPSKAPRRLFLKSPKAHKIERGKQEIRFYTTIAPTMPGVPLTPCYGAGHYEGDGAPFLLLEDVGETHRPPSKTISRVEMEALLDALAQLHATWWNHPGLAELVPMQPQAAFAADFEGNDRRVAELIDRLGDQITSEQRRLFERFVEEAPAILVERATSDLPLTLCHPDGHPDNFLLPRCHGGPVYIVDWHQYRRWWGSRDVVVLIIRSRSSEHRAAGGRSLVRHYHERLMRYGVTDYTWEACWHDYRLGALDYLSFPLAYRHLPAIVPVISEITQLFHDVEGEGLFRPDRSREKH